jgi:predicted acetyltransferase
LGADAWPVLARRMTSRDDAQVLAALNAQLIHDEGHRNAMSIDELESRMAEWLCSDYKAVLFEVDGTVIGYTLFRDGLEFVYVRQFFVGRDHRRKGYGRRAIDLLRASEWNDAIRLRLDVLVDNHAARAFWHAVGFTDYCMTMEMTMPGKCEQGNAADSR